MQSIEINRYFDSTEFRKVFSGATLSVDINIKFNSNSNEHWAWNVYIAAHVRNRIDISRLSVQRTHHYCWRNTYMPFCTQQNRSWHPHKSRCKVNSVSISISHGPKRTHDVLFISFSFSGSNCHFRLRSFILFCRGWLAFLCMAYFFVILHFTIDNRYH